MATPRPQAVAINAWAMPPVMTVGASSSLPPNKPKSSWSWIWWVLLIVLFGIFIYFATKIYDKFTKDVKEFKADEHSSEKLLQKFKLFRDYIILFS